MSGHIEPGTVPAMDRPSIAFARFLDSMEVEEGTHDQTSELVLSCNRCGAAICAVEVGDTLRVLLNTALAHDCEGGV